MRRRRYIFIVKFIIILRWFFLFTFLNNNKDCFSVSHCIKMFFIVIIIIKHHLYKPLFRLLVAESLLYVWYKHHQRLLINYDVDGMHYVEVLENVVVVDVVGNCWWVKLKPLKMCLSHAVVVQCSAVSWYSLIRGVPFLAPNPHL